MEVTDGVLEHSVGSPKSTAHCRSHSPFLLLEVPAVVASLALAPRPAVQKQTSNGPVPPLPRHIQRRAALLILRVDIGPSLDQQMAQARATPDYGAEERRVAVLVPRVDAGPSVEEEGGGGGGSVSVGSDMERCAFFFVGRMYVCAAV